MNRNDQVVTFAKITSAGLNDVLVLCNILQERILLSYKIIVLFGV